MNEADDKAMDFLLRRHARDNAPVSEVADGAGEGLHDHLDADEINAFAENSIPEAARAQYVSHLADCDTCRKLATELLIASAPARIESTPAKPFLSSLGQTIAALFSLPVLRYGVSALFIFGLVLGVLMIFHRREAGEFVAQNEPNSSVQKQSGYPITVPPESSPPEAVAVSPKQNQEETPANVTSADEAGKDKSQPANSSATSSGYAGAANTVQPGFAPEPNAARNDRDEKFRNAPVATAPTKPTPLEDAKLAERSSADELTRTNRNAGALQKEEQPAKRGAEVMSSSPPPPRAGIVTTEVKAKGPRRGREQSESESRSSRAPSERSADASGETRKVSGHTFRNQGNVWVDAAYDSSQPLTYLARDSEQYRSAIKGESGLRAIAEQFGNVIVVWKGKAYRIR
jgi:hypothetical protein